ncbi:MAG: sodium:solute symporter [Smithellaceae bacterium]
MFSLSNVHTIWIIITLAGFSALGIYAGRKVKSAADFAIGGRKAGAAVISGTIMGTLVGGSATVGTAELAFKYGMSAWWFNIGCGIGCAILGLALARSLHESSLQTIPQYLLRTYGKNIEPVTSVFLSIGMFLSIVAQGLAVVALMTSMFPLPPYAAAFIGVLLVLGYVAFGGVFGTGIVGTAKMALLYPATILIGIMAFKMIGGWSGATAKFPAHPWFSFFGRGVTTDLAGVFSLVVGVISTQTYIQAIFSGRTLRDARNGALIAACLIPPMGIFGIIVGLYMRSAFPEIAASQALPLFVINFVPASIAGIILAVLLITTIGTWAGLTLGISTMLTTDIYKKIISPNAPDKKNLYVQRALIIVISLIGALFVAGNLQSTVLSWAFLSMGLRGCSVLIPLLGAMFFSRYVTPLAGLLSATLGPATNLVWRLAFPQGMDPLYPGLTAGLLALVIVSLVTRKKETA